MARREFERKKPPPPRKILGLDWRGNLGLPNRSLQATLEARHQLAGVFRRLRPRLLFAPYWVDAHPDHVAAIELIEAARFWSKLTKSDLPGEPHHPARIIYYNCVHLRLVVQPAFVLDISRFLGAEAGGHRAAIASQFITGRPSQPPTFIDRLRDQAAFWGWSIGAPTASAFASREPIGLAALRDLSELRRLLA